MSWENFFLALMRDEVFFILSAFLALAIIVTLVAFLCFRICRVTLKIILIVVLIYVALVLLLQFSAIASRVPRSIQELGEAIGLPKNFTEADPMAFVKDAWSRARQIGDAWSWANGGTQEKADVDDVAVEHRPRPPPGQVVRPNP
jgi:hypothetical protein